MHNTAEPFYGVEIVRTPMTKGDLHIDHVETYRENAEWKKKHEAATAHLCCRTF
jgi:hypothetical protein